MQLALTRLDATTAGRAAALLPSAVLAAAGVLVFAWLCDAVGDHDGITAIDRPVSTWFAAHRTPLEEHLGLLLAKATSPAVLIVAVVAISAFLWLRHRRFAAGVLAGSVAVAYVAGALAKVGEHRARPSAPINLAPEGEPSFPSGHVLVVATIAFVTIALAWRHLTTGSRVLAVLSAVGVTAVMGIDRLVVGAHWLTDVVGACALAAVVIAAALAAMSARRWSA